MGEEDKEILEEFILESKQNIVEVEHDLLALEENGADSETINKMFRAIHSMKGSSGYLDLKNILSLSHLGETLLDQIRTGSRPADPDTVDALLSMVDALSEMLNLADLGESYDISEAVEKLNNILNEDKEQEEKIKSGSNPQGDTAVNSALYNLPKTAEVITKVNDGIKSNLFFYLINIDPADQSIQKFFEDADHIGVVLASNDSEYLLFGSVLDVELLSDAVGADVKGISVVAKETIDAWLAADADSQSALVRRPVNAEKSENPEPVSARKNPVKSPVKAGVVSDEDKKKKAGNKEESQMIKINAHLLDELLRFTGNMVMSRNQLLTRYDFSDDPAFSTLSQAITEVHKNVVQTRMLSVSTIFDRFKRVVRDLSKKLGKRIDFKQQGGDLELDRTILEAFVDPLNHMIRNSIDHGIETTEERAQTLKNPIASITLKAYQESGEIIISVEDDGRGIDPEKIRKIALDRGLITQAQVKSLSDQDIIMLIFEPGFSTAQKLSEISGRGVGMDVVRTNIEKIGGVVDCSSDLGYGTKMQARLPLTKAMVTSSLISALVVSVDGLPFCIPQSAVNELITVSQKDTLEKIKVLQGKKVFQHRELILPILNLRDILELKTGAAAASDGSEPATAFFTDTQTLIVLQHRHNYFGIMVDKIIGIEEAVVREMPKLVESANVFSGHTVLGDGRVVMLIDTNGIVERMNMTFISQGTVDPVSAPALSVGKRADMQSMIIFNYSNKEYFAVPLELVSLVEKISSTDIKKVGDRKYYPMKDNTIPLLYLDKHLPVTPISQSLDSYNLILPSRVKFPIGVITNSDITVCDVSGKFDEKITHEKGIIGTFMHNGNLVMLLDLYSLFESDDPDHFDRTDRAYRESAQILIVEDSLFYRRLNATYLAAPGRELTLVGDGVEALAALRDTSKHFDLVVSDIEMPNMDGFELIKEIRGDPNLCGIPVIALTALQDDQSRDRGLRLGFNEYVVKVDKDGLNDSVNRFAKEARSRNSSSGNYAVSPLS